MSRVVDQLDQHVIVVEYKTFNVIKTEKSHCCIVGFECIVTPRYWVINITVMDV